jgi:hypothetical protein
MLQLWYRRGGWGGDDGFAVKRQQLHHLVLMDNGGQDGVVVYLPGGFMVGQYIVANC